MEGVKRPERTRVDLKGGGGRGQERIVRGRKREGW